MACAGANGVMRREVKTQRATNGGTASPRTALAEGEERVCVCVWKKEWKI